MLCVCVCVCNEWFEVCVCYLGWVGVYGPDVVHSVRSLQHHFLHVGPDDRHVLGALVLVDQVQEFGDVSHQFLADALASAVDRQLEGRG